MLTTLFASVLGIGVAHAQATGSEPGDVNQGNNSDVQQDQGAPPGAQQKHHQHPNTGSSSGSGSSSDKQDDMGSGTTQGQQPQGGSDSSGAGSSSTGSGSGNGAGSSSGSDIYNTPSQQGTGSSTGGEDQGNMGNQQGGAASPTSPPSGSTSSGSSATGSTAPGASSSTGAGASTGSWPANVQQITLEKGKKVQVNGSFASGQKMSDMQLPGSCISNADKTKFSGNQVLFGAQVPANQDLTVTVTPNNGEKVALYAYAMPTDRFDMPADARDVAVCKSSTKAGMLRGNAEKVKISGAKEARNVVIGVAGGQDVTSGDFTVSVEAQ